MKLLSSLARNAAARACSIASPNRPCSTVNEQSASVPPQRHDARPSKEAGDGGEGKGKAGRTIGMCTMRRSFFSGVSKNFMSSSAPPRHTCYVSIGRAREVSSRGKLNRS